MAENAVTASYMSGDRLVMEVRGHSVFADQPVGDGGDDTAPTPTELFIASLAGCIGFYAERFLRRSQLSTAGLKVTCEYGWAENPHRVGRIAVIVDAPGLTSERQAAFRRVIDHCTVHNTLAHPPEIRIEVAPASVSAA
jgi:putative redox protein